MPTFTDPESIEWYRYPALAENPLTESRITPMIQNSSFPASQSTPTAVGAFS